MRTTREVIAEVYAALGRPARLTVLNRPMLRTIGLFNRNVRELLSTYYQFDAPFVADHSAFTADFGGHVTGWAEIIEATLASYRTRAQLPSGARAAAG